MMVAVPGHTTCHGLTSFMACSVSLVIARWLISLFNALVHPTCCRSMTEHVVIAGVSDSYEVLGNTI